MITPREREDGVTVFVDLDGTLVRINSFHLFLRRLAAGDGLYLAARLRLWWTLGRAAVRRAAKLDSHAQLKRAVQRAWAALPLAQRDAFLDAFLPRLEEAVRPQVLEFANEMRRRGAAVVLATAAPAEYAAPFARRLGFEHYLSTPVGEATDWVHLLGPAKRQACHEFMSGRGDSRFVIVTDHIDDLPLILEAERAVITCGLAMRQRILSAAGERGGGERLALFDEHATPVGGGYWIWFSGEMLGPLPIWEVKTLISKHRHAWIYTEAGRWMRCPPGFDLQLAAQRAAAPPPPPAGVQRRARAMRIVVRDRMGIYH